MSKPKGLIYCSQQWFSIQDVIDLFFEYSDHSDMAHGGYSLTFEAWMEKHYPQTKPLDKVSIEEELCMICGQHLVAKNTVTGEQICTNEKCKNYNADFMKKSFTVTSINPLLKQNEK